VTARASATDALVGLVSDLPGRSLPALARERARVAFLDCIACIMAGSQTATGQIVAAYVKEQGGRADAVVAGHGLRAPAAEAALVNGAAAHALDYDDIVRQLGHPSVVLVPALLAAGERASSSGKDLITAYVVGFEVISRTLRHMNPAHFDRGWHATSTVGVLGATAAIAVLLRVDGAAIRNAIGIAASASAGLRKSYGSMVKPLHAGMAAHNALVAVDLAQRGFTADANSLDGTYGFLNVYRGDSEPNTDFAELLAPERPLSLTETGLTIKRFACCGASHAAVDGILQLRAEHPEIADPDHIESVDSTVNQLAADILFHHVAHTGDQGRFSMEYSLAAALLDGWLGLEQFSSERVADPRVQALSRRVRMVVDPAAKVDYANWPARVDVVLKDGRHLTTTVERPKGHPDNPLSPADLQAKFNDCCEPVLGKAATARALEMLVGLESLGEVNGLAATLMGEC